MAKTKELTPLKKGTAQFTLVGKAKVKDYTFTLDAQSSKEDSDWIYNNMNIAIDCGSYGDIYAELMGGYGSARDNVIYVHGKKENENEQMVDDFDKQYTIAWEDRFDEDIISEIGDLCFLTVGLEKDESDKTVYKKFLTPYDAIAYIEANLEDGMVVNVKGNLEYNKYKDTLQVRKKITSLVLSKAEEKDFKAIFTQALLLDSNAVGSVDKETRTIPIDAYVLERVTEFNGTPITYEVKGRKKKGTVLPLFKTFSFAIGDDIEKAKKQLKIFKVKGKKYTQLVVDGYFTRGQANTVEVTEDDIPDDIKELIDLGLYEKDEILGQIALKNGNKKPEVMIIKAPHIKFNTNSDGVKIPSVDKETEKYTEDDLEIEAILNNLGVELKDQEVELDEEDEDDDYDELDSELDALLDEME